MDRHTPPPKRTHQVGFYRIGIVEAQDLELGRLRVKFPDRDQMLSYWLQVVFPKTLSDKFYWMPDVGEQVVCLMDEFDEGGAVVGAVYSTVDTTPVQSSDKAHVTFKDGTSFEYDRAQHVLDINFSDGAVIKYAAAQGQSAAALSFSLPAGNFTVSTGGNVTVQAGGNATVSAQGQVAVDAPHIVLAGGGPAIARVGDATICPAGTGSISSGSEKVQSG